VHTSPEVVEDACHHAWTKLINQGDDVNRDAALVWLARTAIREAWKLDRRERRELSLDGALEEQGEPALPARLPDPAERAEQRERLRELSRLSERQRRLVWLRAAGLSYVEMAAFTGDSVRTVERQVLRASRSLRREGERPPPEQQLSR